MNKSVFGITTVGHMRRYLFGKMTTSLLVTGALVIAIAIAVPRNYQVSACSGVLIGSALYVLVSALHYFLSLRWICPVCRNPDDPLNIIGYWRGRGKHEWHF